MSNRIDPYKNGKFGILNFYPDQMTIRFNETTVNGESFLFPERIRNDENSPILANGVLAYIAKYHNEMDTLTLFENYINIGRKQFMEAECKKADAPLRELETEFITLFIEREREWASYPPMLYEYIPDEYVNELNEYVIAFIAYLEKKRPLTFSTKSNGFDYACIALIHIYRETEITKSNEAEILSSFGFEPSKTNKLVRKYKELLEDNMRVGSNESARKDKPRVKRMEKVVAYLKSQGLDSSQAEKELSILKESMENN